ncbi:MAG: DUF3737 family protein [Clostridiales bacterium]|nr:DUF3737 family protein [Candidatus Equinaster intestinalis]
MEIITNKTFDEERALYALDNAKISNCNFCGAADGESALKEAKNIEIENCKFELRYPLWHNKGFKMRNSFMDITCRAPIWYSENGEIADSEIIGVKCLRECKNILLKNTKTVSPEFGWKCENVTVENGSLDSEYAFFESRELKIKKLNFSGKYSFQYVENAVIEDCILDTKDAFWHSKNVTVKNCTVKGEYLGWYSENLKLINCKIIGTQPLCYCENLTLENCTMEQTDLSFEYSGVFAEINGNIESVKNPKSGRITADTIGEIILENSVIKTECEIITKY